MATWPGSLPTSLLLGLRRTAAEGSLRAPTDTGPGKVRRIETSTPIFLDGDLLLTGTEAQALETFYKTTTSMGSVQFDGLSDPLTGTAHDAVFAARPTYSGEVPASAAADRTWRATVSLVLLP